MNYVVYNRFIPKAIFLAAVFIFFFAGIVHADDAQQPSSRALLYVTNSASALSSLRAHIGSMDIIAPQTYASDAAGKLLGAPNAEILKLAHDSGAQVMPLVVNQYFCQQCMHLFLVSDAAQDRLVIGLIAEAKTRGYIGYQYDFEHMFVTDKDLYSAFVARSAALFHTAGLQFSVAVAPRHSDLAADYGAGSWNNWTGAFDYGAIGAVADFVSVMAYDDSRSVGPTASLPWVNQVLTYSLHYIPADKISLGIPFYTWVSRTKTGQLDHIVGYPAVAKVLTSKKYLAKGWSSDLGVSYVTYMKTQGHVTKKFTAWYEDQKSFEQKIALVSQYKLQGFSGWALGLEDPNIWKTMLALRAATNGLALNH